MSDQPLPTPSAGVTTDQIMDFLVENMVTRKELDYELGEIRSDIKDIRDTMVTKEHLQHEFGKFRSEMTDFIDKRLLNLKTDLVVIVKGEDQKLTALIELMKKKELLTPHEAQGLISMHPLSQVV